MAGPRSAAYHVSKFGLVGFTESLRAEYGRRGIGVTALCPGPVRTNLYKSAVSGSKRKAVPVPPAWLCTTPAQIADKAVHAIRKNRRLVVITPIAHVLFNAKRFAPWFLDLLNHFTLRKRRPPRGQLPRRRPVCGRLSQPRRTRKPNPPAAPPEAAAGRQNHATSGRASHHQSEPQRRVLKEDLRRQAVFESLEEPIAFLGLGHPGGAIDSKQLLGRVPGDSQFLQAEIVRARHQADRPSFPRRPLRERGPPST